MMVDWLVDINQHCLSNSMQQWLTQALSISQTMKKITQAISLTVLNQAFSQAWECETEFLQLTTKNKVLVREIFLLGNQIPWSFGRVIIPEKTYLAHKLKFDHLNNQFIGETLLHHNPNSKRGAFEYGQLSQQDKLYRRIESYRGITFNDCLWARRSQFDLDHLPLMITEVYLPDLPLFPN